MKNNQLINTIFEEVTSVDKGYETRIEIGGVVILIRTDNYEINSLLKEKFSAFHSTAIPQMVIEIQVKEKIQTEDEKDISLVKGEKLFVSRGNLYSGIVDFNQKKGQMLIIQPEKIEKVIEGIIRRCISYFLIDFEGVFLHGASIVVEPQRGFIFCGDSGCGKTTIANLSDKYTVLNDDLTLIRKIDDEYKMYSTPFYGHRLDRYVCAKIESLILPRKNKTVYIEKSQVHNTLKEILKNIVLLFYELPHSQMDKLFGLCCDLVEKVPSYDLYFLPDSSFWTPILNLQEKRGNEKK